MCKSLHESGEQSSEWFLNLASLLGKYGFNSVPDQVEEVKSIIKIVNLALECEYVEKWKAQVNESPKCSALYKHIKHIFEREYYLENLPDNLRLAISRIRTSNHRLPIEVGRYADNVPREERICTHCDTRAVGDEYHFILTCTNPTLLVLREKYISPYYTLNPSLTKLKELFLNRGRKLFKLARYIEEGLRLY